MYGYIRLDLRIIQAYMMVGGIPYYLNYFEKTKSLAQNIDSLFFTENAPLQEEYSDLFASLFVNPDTMHKIVRALNRRKSGLTRQELLDETEIPDSGDFSNHLKALISGDFIIRYTPYGSGKKGERFKLVDPFCLFYFHFVEEGKRKHISWVNLEDSASVSAWRGLAYENVCFNHVDQIKKALGISGVSTSESLWQHKGQKNSPGAQVDMIIERRDRIINLCEIKFYNDLYGHTTEEHLALVRRRNLLMEVIPKRFTIHNVLITTYGLKRNEYMGDFIHVITMHDLFDR